MKDSIIKEARQLIANGKIERALQLVLSQDLSEHENEILLHSNRLQSLMRDMRLGIIDYREKTVTENQITYGLLETLKAMSGVKEVSVLVAGVGRRDLVDYPNVFLAAVELGKLLGQNNFNLISGGWPGVDYVVSSNFAKALRQNNRPLSEKLIQVVKENTEPDFKGGKIINVKEGSKEWTVPINYADVVVLIGGEGGTYGTFVYAHQEIRPVIPIPGSGGDAQLVYNKIMSNWDYWGQNSLKGITKSDFEALNQPIHTNNEARSVAEGVLRIIRQLTS